MTFSARAMSCSTYASTLSVTICMTAFAISRISVSFSLVVPVDKAYYLRDVLRLVAYALHVGYHFQRRGYLPQVAPRAAAAKERQAHGLYRALLLVYLRVQRATLAASLVQQRL